MDSEAAKYQGMTIASSSAETMKNDQFSLTCSQQKDTQITYSPKSDSQGDGVRTNGESRLQDLQTSRAH